MRKNLLLSLAVISTSFALPPLALSHEKEILLKNNRAIDVLLSIIQPNYEYSKWRITSLNEIQTMLHEETNTLNKAVIHKVLTTLRCVNKFNMNHNNVLTIIDYSLPSSKKRIWVFDLNEKKLLFHTYVSHGLNSGFLLSNYFSNKYNSKASSIGVYKTEKSYYGRDGISLRLDGLDKGFNDNASGRAVVMHGGWYVNENFIKKYGRAGRSWGCPALPIELTAPIINTIKDQTLFVIYYPSDNWFGKSKFLNCDSLLSMQNKTSTPIAEVVTKPSEERVLREEILFAAVHKNNEAIVVMPVDHYQRIFHNKAPLTRMLRRQINDTEYIALSTTEFKNLVASQDKDSLNAVYFAIAVIKMRRGYYATEMKIVDLGKIKEFRLTDNSARSNHYVVDFEAKPSISLRATNQFIRWLGL